MVVVVWVGEVEGGGRWERELGRKQKGIDKANSATVREKCIANQNRERENEYRSSEIRPIRRTVRQKLNTGNSKMATVPQKFIASQHREHETRTVRR